MKLYQAKTIWGQNLILREDPETTEQISVFLHSTETMYMIIVADNSLEDMYYNAGSLVISSNLEQITPL